MHTKFWSQNLNGRGTSETYVLIRILIWILKDIRREVVDSIQLVEDRAECWALVSMATDLQVP
jgi:hypothetical protein